MARITKSKVPPRPTYTQPIPRYRGSYQIKAIPVTEEQRLAGCLDSSNWIYSGALSPNYVGEYRQISDWVTPRFRQRVREGEVFFNPMFSSVLAMEYAGGGFMLTNRTAGCMSPLKYSAYRSQAPFVTAFLPKQGTNSFGQTLPLFYQSLSNSDVSRVQQEVTTAMLSKRGRNSDADIWESLAEYRQTMALLENPITQLATLSERMRIAYEKGALVHRLAVREISSGYLMWKFGIQPIIKDLFNVVESLQKRQLGHQRLTYRAQEDLFSTRSLGATSSVGVITADWTCQVRDSLRVKAVSLEEVHMSLLNNMGLTLKSFITLPWELMSYSFVADMVLNIGDYIGSTVPALGFKNLGSCLVTTRAYSNAFTIGNSRTTAAWTLNTAPFGSVGVSYIEKTRGSLVAPALVWKSDSVLDSPSKMVSLLALAAQRLTGFGRLFGSNPPRAPTRRDREVFERWATAVGAVPYKGKYAYKR